VEDEPDARLPNLSVDFAVVLERLSKRVDALANDRRQRDVSGSGRRGGSVPRGMAQRRGECYECGSASHYRNRCPLLQTVQLLN
jgi:hypothetical protein